jgi:hypothetical protein
VGPYSQAIPFLGKNEALTIKQSLSPSLKGGWPAGPRPGGAPEPYRAQAVLASK